MDRGGTASGYFRLRLKHGTLVHTASKPYTDYSKVKKLDISIRMPKLTPDTLNFMMPYTLDLLKIEMQNVLRNETQLESPRVSVWSECTF